MLRKLLRNHRGTAEVIGTIMMVMILLFFFTNVYVYHATAVKQMNELNLKKLSAQMDMNYADGELNVTAEDAKVTLARLWIKMDGDHVFADLEQFKIQVMPGDNNYVTIRFSPGNVRDDGYGALFVNAAYDGGRTITVYCSLPASPSFTMVNTLGIATSC
jgi:hypothetical protein